jgi:hypothetical protein
VIVNNYRDTLVETGGNPKFAQVREIASMESAQDRDTNLDNQLVPRFMTLGTRVTQTKSSMVTDLAEAEIADLKIGLQSLFLFFEHS